MDGSVDNRGGVTWGEKMVVFTWAWTSSVELSHGDFQGLVLRREKLG